MSIQIIWADSKSDKNKSAVSKYSLYYLKSKVINNMKGEKFTSDKKEENSWRCTKR